MSCSTRLTPRQIGILHLRSDGWSRKAIASMLAISSGTLSNHVRSILERLYARNLVHAAAMVARCERDSA